mgnify:CR=1 FL=1
MENDISGMIAKIIQNPEFADMVKEIRGGDESTDEVQKEMMEKLPGVLSMVSPLIGGNTSEGETKEKSGSEKPEEKPAPPKYDKGRAEKLMGALKPYLKPERQQIIDRCMQLSDVMGAFGGLEGLMGKSK